MKLVNGYSSCVYGNEYAESTLKSMKKSTLIELLRIAQRNYDAVLESHGNVQKYAEQLQKDAKSKSNWIPVEESITDKEVLCCNERGGIMIGFLTKDGRSKTGYDAQTDVEFMYDIVAWQPLPQPYVKKKTDD